MSRFAEALERLGFDEVSLDRAGNVIGVFERGDGPQVLYNGHLDTVPTGDEAAWPHGPLSGEVVDGELWGRGSVDMKSALACMAYGAKDAAQQGFRGTLIVSAVVQEEVGGLGARHLAEHLARRFQPDVVILGEPSSLNLMLGHRGRLELEVSLPGAIAHAARSELGDNALYRAADFLGKLRGLELPQGGILGGSSLTPTQLRSFPEDGRNVVPGRVELVIDYRTIPGDDAETVLARLREIAPEADIRIPVHEAASENGEVRLRYPQALEPYLAPGENRFVGLARTALKASLEPFGVPYQEGVWWFATDAPHLALMNAPVIGFGPGDEELAHTTRERVPLGHLEVARAAYGDLALAFQETL